MKKYHLTNEGPKPCNANSRSCPLSENVEHFSSFWEAKKVYEEKMSDEYGGVSTVSKSGDHAMPREEMQQEIDLLEEAMDHIGNNDIWLARATIDGNPLTEDLIRYDHDDFQNAVSHRLLDLMNTQKELDY